MLKEPRLGTFETHTIISQTHTYSVMAKLETLDAKKSPGSMRRDMKRKILLGACLTWNDTKDLTLLVQGILFFSAGGHTTTATGAQRGGDEERGRVDKIQVQTKTRGHKNELALLARGFCEEVTLGGLSMEKDRTNL